MIEFGKILWAFYSLSLANGLHSSFFQNEEIFVQLDELGRITHARIGFN